MQSRQRPVSGRPVDHQHSGNPLLRAAGGIVQRQQVTGAALRGQRQVKFGGLACDRIDPASARHQDAPGCLQSPGHLGHSDRCLQGPRAAPAEKEVALRTELLLVQPRDSRRRQAGERGCTHHGQHFGAAAGSIPDRRFGAQGSPAAGQASGQDDRFK